MKQTEAKKQLIETRRAAGQCIQCGQDAGGKSRCAGCAEAAKHSRKKSQDKKKAAGICQNSGCHRAAMPGRTVCETCSARAGQAANDRYHRNKAAGVCCYCGGPSGGRARCDKCMAKFSEYSVEYYHQKKAEGLCPNCGVPVDPDDAAILCVECREDKSDAAKLRWQRLRDAAFAAYGGYACAGCNCTDAAVLELDHVGGGGNEHRREIGQSNLYLWLKQQNYPVGFRVLCPTCNKKAHRGIPLPSSCVPSRA